MSDYDEDQQLAEFDRLLAAINEWTARAPHWPSFAKAAAIWARVEPRLRELQSRLDRVLVVGIVGGTGTGKSTLVNALVGTCVSPASDIQRPTTTRPVVVCHPDVDASFLNVGRSVAGSDATPTRSVGEPDRDGPSLAAPFELTKVDAPLLAGMILIDCPDPDTQGDATEETANRNRDLLRRVLPQCDVMLFVATAQKYKTAAVAEEVLAHAPGRQVVFVQTHATRDHDIRADWRRQLEAMGFIVPPMFLIDSEEALAAHERGEPAMPALQQLREFLRTELAARARHRIRRGNALDLVAWWQARARQEAENLWPAVAALEARIAVEEARLSGQVRDRLATRWRANRQWWRQLLFEQATRRWGSGPFAAFLRFVNRPLAPWRSFAPLTHGFLLGSALTQQSRGPRPTMPVVANGGSPDSDGDWTSAAEIGISEADLAEARSVLAQQANRAGLSATDSDGDNSATSDAQQVAIGSMIRQLGGRAAAAVDLAIERRVARYAGPIFHGFLEALFILLLGLLVARLGWNFFYEYTWLGKPLLGLDYLVYAAIWLFVWGLFLRWLLAIRMERGWRREISALAENLNCREIVGQLFADFRRPAARIRRHVAALEAIDAQRRQLGDRSGSESNGDRGRLGRLRQE
ncbi:MAG TPA: dynamin family protein [Pirellulales bacterium]|nr:dynamin family protein [Pirellulales bacterium]